MFGTSLQAIFGWMLAPVAYLMGVPWEDCAAWEVCWARAPCSTS